MFVVMEELLTWAERLANLEKGKTIQLKDDESEQSVYSAIRTHFKGSGKTFSIRTPKGLRIRFVIRMT